MPNFIPLLPVRLGAAPGVSPIVPGALLVRLAASTMTDKAFFNTGHAEDI
jgi:hypothetical protein